jgi:hypothetical protein
MQDIDRVADVEGLAAPAGLPRFGIDAKSTRFVRCSKCAGRISWDRRPKWDIGEQMAGRRPELKRAVRRSLEPIALFMDRTVMPATQ